jgi:hypothetical protein
MAKAKNIWINVRMGYRGFCLFPFEIRDPLLIFLFHRQNRHQLFALASSWPVMVIYSFSLWQQ